MEFQTVVKYCEEKDAHIDKSKLTAGEIPQECINCILDDILSTREEWVRKMWIELYKEGMMGLRCKLTGEKYVVNEDFFKKIKNFE